MKLSIEVEIDADGWYVVSSESMPGCLAQGKTLPAALDNMADAAEAWMEVCDDDPSLPGILWR